MPRKAADGDPTNKQKKKRTAPTNTSLLPPCKVCLEPAAGFHYGANTCEACKGFFRRTLLRKKDYQCLNGDEKCNIEKAGKLRMCPRCRHLKCLAVGMSVGAIKTGRYTHVKRTQDILEYKQAMEQVDNNNTTVSPSPGVSPGPPVSAAAAAPSPAVRNPVRHVPRVDSPSSHTNRSAMSGVCMSVPSSQDCVSDPRFTAPSAVQDLTLPRTIGSALSQLSSTGYEPVQTCVSTDVASPFSPQDVSSPVLMSSFIDSIFNNMAEGEPGRCDDSVSVGSKDAATPASASSQEYCTLSPPATVMDCMSDEECERMVHHLVESHEAYGVFKYDLSADEMLEKQKLCIEEYRARIEAFGPLGKLSEEEYQDIYQTTGIDVDDRQSFVTLLSKMFDDHIRSYIGFVQSIPGFCDLSMQDQVRLIKDNRCEVAAIGQAVGFNYELQVMTMPSGRTFCTHYMEKFSSKELMKCRTACLRAIQKLGLSQEETVLFKCLILFTQGNDDVDEPERVSAIQWKMAQCLRWLLRRNGHPHPDRRFAAVISTFLVVRQSASNFYEWIKSKPFEHYAQFKQNELLAEWFSNS